MTVLTHLDLHKLLPSCMTVLTHLVICEIYIPRYIIVEA
jgi:hypothetical protein